MRLRAHNLAQALAVLAASLLLSAAALADRVSPEEQKDRTEALPGRLQNVNVTEKFGESLPLDAELTDSTGRPRVLAEFFDGSKPVILTFNYSDCPMLCSLQLNKFVGGLKQLERTAGADFRIITISIDPKETTAKAAETKARYLRDYARPEAAGGWDFLTASEETTRRIAGSVGFEYSYNEARGEWLHAAALMVMTPSGKMARYLYGVQYHPETLNLALVEASEGKIGSTLDRLILYCFHYDETEGRYAPVAMNIMRVAAGAAALALGVFLALYWRGEARKKQQRLSVRLASISQ